MLAEFRRVLFFRILLIALQWPLTFPQDVLGVRLRSSQSKISHKLHSSTPSFNVTSLLSFSHITLKQSPSDVASASCVFGKVTCPLLSPISKSCWFHPNSRWENNGKFNVFRINYFVGKQKGTTQKILQALIINCIYYNLFQLYWLQYI